MIITEREVKRIVEKHFKSRYNMDIDPKSMEWELEENDHGEYYAVKGLEIGGVIDEEDY